MMSPALWITEAEAVEMISMADTLDAVERGLLLEAHNDAMTMPKTVVRFGDGSASLQALGAASAGIGLAVTKTWLQTKQGGWPLIVVFDVVTGRKRAVIEATALSQMRTGALAGIATRRLADTRADELGLIGTGRQAWTQVAAVAAARKLKRLRIWSPTAVNRARFADHMRTAFGFTVDVTESAADAVRDAPIVTVAAHIVSPVLSSAMLARGTHVNAVSVTVSGRAELNLDVLPRCSMVCTDTTEGVRNLSDEFRAYYGGRNAWHEVVPLAAVVARDVARPANADLTLYKGMGTGIADLALAIEVLARAIKRGIGQPLPETVLTNPRLTG